MSHDGRTVGRWDGWGYLIHERSAESGFLDEWPDRNTQNSFPSGSAMTTHGTSRWPM